MPLFTRLIASALLLTTIGLPAATWQTDLSAAQAQARQDGKFVMVNYTGSDWCSWCMKLKQEVFTQQQFEEYADKHLVLVEIDFPKKTQLTPTQKKVNSTLAKAMNVSSFPTIVFLHPNGKELGRLGYRPGGPAAFIQEASRIMGTSAPLRPAGPALPAPFAGAATFPPVRYTELILKNISGSESRRFALLNNQTFAQGETALVKMLDGEVEVRCLEIRADSVLIAVKGDPAPREIRVRR